MKLEPAALLAEAIDRMRSAQDELQLNKAQAIADIARWMAENNVGIGTDQSVANE